MATYNEGYYEQSTYDEEHADLAALKRFGYPISNKPILDIGTRENILGKEVYGQGYKSLESGPQVADLVSARFIPVNGRFLYWILGKRSAATGTRTISNLDYTARKQFISVWKQVNNRKEHVYGTMFDSMSLAMKQGGMPTVSLVGKGLNVASNSFTPTITWKDSVESPFTNMSGMTWDGDALTPYACTVNLRCNSKPIQGYDGTYQDINGQVPVYGTIQAMCSATEGETAFADYNDSDAKTFTVTLGKGTADHSTHSLAGTFANARIREMNKQESLGLEPVYTLLIEIQTASWLVTDGL